MAFRRKGPKIVVSGYYGFDNCGDEALLLAIIHCLRKLRPDARIVVLSGNPAKTAAVYGVRAVDRWKPLSVAMELLTCRLLISGGGSLIQDVTSARSPKYYLAVILSAALMGKKVMLYGQGVGPLADPGNRKWAARILKRCHEIAVRDARSAELLKELGVERDIQVACDPVMALSYEDVNREEIRKELQEMNILDDSGRKRKPLLLVAMRSWKDNRHMAPVAELLDAQARMGWDVLLVPAFFPADMEAVNEIGNRMTERLYCLGQCLSAGQFLALTAYADRVFSMRLHGLISAMAMGAPMLGLSYDPKVDAFMEQAGLERYCLSYEDFDWETAVYLMEEMEASPLESRQEQERRRLEMQGQAWDMAERAVGLLS
ncbi:MAG: polysaccharide pyruvyl transferase CsaB [Clostridiales bacterium]|nr:polysaccharide pyruvyl transferase CsaB [Clostridiales bacterium]